MDVKTAEFIKSRFGDSHEIEPNIYHEPCNIPFSRLNIDPEGNFNACCSVDPLFADALNRPLKELYNHPQTLKLRVMNQLRRFPTICKKYCHKIPSAEVDTSIENLQNMLLPRKQAGLKWEPAGSIPVGSRLLLWPFGTLSKKLLNSSLLKAIKLQAITDKNPELWGQCHGGITILSPKEAASLDIDAILISSGAYYMEILAEIKRNPRLSSKKIFRTDLNGNLRTLASGSKLVN